MQKYHMMVCKCGRIHMIDNKKIDNALENNKNLLLICGGCGKALLIGADLEPNLFDPGESCYMMYSSEFSSYENKSITSTDFETTEDYKGIEEIIYSHGIRVPMMTGMYATDYLYGMFADRWYPDFYKIQREDVTVKEIIEFINEYNRNRTTVDMKRFINETKEEFLEVISNYSIEGLNWKGTKWETEWNSK